MTRTQRGNPEELPPDVRRHAHEPRDVPPRAVVYTVAGLFAALIVSGLLLLGMFRIFEQSDVSPVASALQTATIISPQPHLESSPSENRVTLELAAKARLDGLGWTKREAGLAHIPIEEAMRILAENGWPDTREGVRQ